MKGIRDWLSEALGGPAAVRKVRALLVLRRWPEVVGPVVARRSAPERYDRGIVWVAVSGSAWAQELRSQKEQLLEKLNATAGEQDLFKDLRFGVRPFEPIQPREGCQQPVEGSSRPSHSFTIRELAERRRAKRARDGGDSQ